MDDARLGGVFDIDHADRIGKVVYDPRLVSVERQRYRPQAHRGFPYAAQALTSSIEDFQTIVGRVEGIQITPIRR